MAVQSAVDGIGRSSSVWRVEHQSIDPRSTSAAGQSRRFERAPAASGLAAEPDISLRRTNRRGVPDSDMARGRSNARLDQVGDRADF